jgi:hypothetical protein
MHHLLIVAVLRQKYAQLPNAKVDGDSQLSDFERMKQYMAASVKRLTELLEMAEKEDRRLARPLRATIKRAWYGFEQGGVFE